MGLGVTLGRTKPVEAGLVALAVGMMTGDKLVLSVGSATEGKLVLSVGSTTEGTPVEVDSVGREMEAVMEG